MFCFDYCNRVEDYLWKIVVSVDTLDDIYKNYTSYNCPKLYRIKDIAHVIVVFPTGEIFNCNPRDYPLDIRHPLSIMRYGIENEQIEPSSKVYENYWNDHWDKVSVVTSAIEVDKNCGLWSGYYLWWYYNKNDKLFACSLIDLEKWVKLVCNDYLDKNKELF